MSQFEKKEIIQAILIADNNVEQFHPFSSENSTALLPLVNVSMIDYALEALNRSGIEEVFVYSSLYLQNVRDHIKRGIATLSSWSISMSVQVIGGEGCRCFGDAMRDLDAKALIRGNFILLGADTVTNVDLRPIIEQHKKTVKYDKGAAATLVFKESSTNLRTGNEIMIAMDVQNNRLHHHQRLRQENKERQFEVPLEVFINNSQVALLHDLLDPQIAIGSPTLLSLFSDNFDFLTRDDFVRGILINEEILDSRIYVSLLARDQYARKVNNWLSYQIVSQDIINRWAYPLVPDMGIHCLSQQYLFLTNNIYKSSNVSITKATLSDNVVVQSGSIIEAGASLKCSVVGVNCKIGQNCNLTHAYLMENVTIEDGCTLTYCFIGSGTIVKNKSHITDGTVIGKDCIIPANSKLVKAKVVAIENEEDTTISKLGDKAFIIDDIHQESNANCSDSEDEDILPQLYGTAKMAKLPLVYAESDYTSSSEEEESQRGSPLPDDTNIFLSEVMDSLARGFQEKSNPDFLILEINSSRYAYNMSLKEVNFYVVKAIFSLQSIKEPTNKNILIEINNVLKQLGPVMSNYIKTEDAMLECLKALQDICDENLHVREKISQVVHFLYDKDFVTENAIVTWYEDINDDENLNLKKSLSKLIQWLNQSSDEDESDD
ncbi:translation initiation factor eIF-2B subunit epsilon [Teleopsis dalmanni]|uniref:translation initiation factor eIF-2B subunit epsilon n=1 Tax=Teleopsis dalmanni TaxID=139649 RepID=UPI0018CD937A|nr:translation initiation factor eIF-2B subunit epsilon [Teleopsis dalmanni]